MVTKDGFGRPFCCRDPLGAKSNEDRSEPMKMKSCRNGGWLAMGAGIGVAMGVATGNLALWLAIGVAIGAAMDARHEDAR